MTNGLVQHIPVEESTSIQWVNRNGIKMTKCTVGEYFSRKGFRSFNQQWKIVRTCEHVIQCQLRRRALIFRDLPSNNMC